MNKTFFLGRLYDLASGQSGLPLEYNPADLTTHAVVTGMTGSGKTGLCLALLEEAALQGIPAILIDPKGDLTNLLLHFPNLAPQDFAPWLDADSLRRQGKTLEQAAAETAEQWKNGLAQWNIPPERLRALQESAQFGVFTPGSDAGLRISVLSSLEAPDLPWEGNREILREQISSAAIALLTLVGYANIDPLRSREHILLANLFEAAWSKNTPLNLTELILQVQNPPFDKLGAFPLETFFPAKERAELAITLNNILASPAFQSWREGQPMHIPSLLFTPEGKPRHSVFYLAHLSEGERMFFVTLLLSAYETWMRSQTGSTSLRALLYFDELFGYLPPSLNPPSKIPLLRMLKQARAFGIGLILATQNPVDVDYKALSNAGTWFIGKLQTERDKERLLEGLQGANAGGTSGAGADLDREAYGRIISALGKRIFLLHNIHQPKAQIFQTRWTMNFLAGPLTRAQIPAVNRLANAEKQKNAPAESLAFSVDSAPEAESTPQPDFSHFQPLSVAGAESTLPPDFSPLQPLPASSGAAPRQAELPGSLTRPAIPGAVDELFQPVTLSISEAFRAAGESAPVDARLEAMLYRPALLAAARVRLLDRRYGVESDLPRVALAQSLDRRGVVRWEDCPYSGPPLENLERQPAPQARYAAPDAPLLDAKLLAALQKDFADWVYRSSVVSVRANEALKIYAGPESSAAEFRSACANAAREARDREIAKTEAVFTRQLAQLQDKIAREQRELRQDEDEYQNRKWEENATHAENVFGLFTGKSPTRRVSSSLTKRRLSEQAKADVQESQDALQQFAAQVAELERRRAESNAEINERWAQAANRVREISLTPKKSDVFVERFGVLWLPFYLIRAGGELYELPA
ncbi:MAG: DUF87 domain-containing protein [Anaerolineales bacterium]